MRLSREVRIFAPPGESGSEHLNTWAGTPNRPGGQPFWTLRAQVAGGVDKKTGYLCDIKEIDQLLRETVAPLLFAGLEGGAGRAIQRAFTIGRRHFPKNVRLAALEWGVSPYLSIALSAETSDMVSITQSFEFSAAHRLSGPGFTAEENLRVFGKCSNPHGHGHNYVFEVTVSGPPDGKTGAIVDLPALQRTVRERVVEPFDHRNLNVECAEFATLNPSVENIAVVIWRRLHGGFEPARLTKVRVWETPKTSAEYAGE